MKTEQNRRTFIKTTALAAAGIGIGANSFAESLYPASKSGAAVGTRVGIIGLDTSHVIAFTKALNGPNPSPDYSGFKVVAAYPYGSKDIKSSYERIPGYIEDVKKLGVEITDSIASLLDKVDFVLLETNDGRLHLEQALQVIKAGKRFFIDKPIAASLADASAIFSAAKKANVGVFSASSLRYSVGAQEIAGGKYGKVLGAETFSPCHLESTHPDLFWYGIHGVESLFTVMGPGCKQVVRISSPEVDVVVGTWNDGRVGTFRGLRSGKLGYGGTVFTEKATVQIGEYGGYNPLLKQITDFFKTGVVPVSSEDTLDMCAFMEAADESKRKGGVPVSLADIYARAARKNR
ncbi:MAG: Gfo/Idh/MocA family oxidoreductase [Pedobacter sp.]|nr:Gfo/Idh/MocA family oxidoreductase [Pedobacter sp.]